MERVIEDVPAQRPRLLSRATGTNGRERYSTAIQKADPANPRRSSRPLGPFREIIKAGMASSPTELAG